MQDGRTRLAYKPEHAVDLDAIVAVTIHPAELGDTTILADTLAAAAPSLDEARLRSDDRRP